ncbi:unnamed protein product [Allacma fusca]|uniref:Uncharacterized protein n=1 Tax=Allacma fusca TaxID=39272 RepID=A0A8J2PAL1_9HEXA|nr:unnamed protein product [Allacma fusca]
MPTSDSRNIILLKKLFQRAAKALSIPWTVKNTNNVWGLEERKSLKYVHGVTVIQIAHTIFGVASNLSYVKRKGTLPPECVVAMVSSWGFVLFTLSNWMFRREFQMFANYLTTHSSYVQEKVKTPSGDLAVLLLHPDCVLECSETAHSKTVSAWSSYEYSRTDRAQGSDNFPGTPGRLFIFRTTNCGIRCGLLDAILSTNSRPGVEVFERSFFM